MTAPGSGNRITAPQLLANEAGIETACVKKIKHGTFKIDKLFRENDSDVIVDVTVSAKKFCPILPDPGA
ncbi:uncharacterized protein N7473_008674 [Penicillium subrubescens]|jgi:hypothetical protein|uniref:Uncharacterized protein n=1 Tax=Penicillium subrubescens TaxID=1316194 RepID=A0A1Q5U0B1_9EURO|nr:uncharacterized protein N7473_008674 [Penicillium subrubescens]KAJ5886000.1 hypothetical protein N7473_008674 [Penicillium subrubescens]OKP05909.1 hypothetical protein PENSUB_6629 [Penicillium subrubescens]